MADNVLNAFRHLRKEHLAALSLGRQFVACSTPFGIYGKNTWGERLSTVSTWECSTPFGIYGKNTTVYVLQLFATLVLNAFRHLRKEHHHMTLNIDGDYTCSTPFGIYGKNTRPAGTLGVVTARVLNAFRHLRKEHASGDRMTDEIIECSTPFGIYGKNTV